MGGHRRNSPCTRKFITRVIAFVLLGAIVNVAVAWGCAAWVNPIDPSKWVPPSGYSIGERGPPRNSYLYWAVRVEECLGAKSISSDWLDPDIRMVDVPRLFPVVAPELLIPPWGSFLIPPSTPTKQQMHSRGADARGWPMLSMWSGRLSDGNFVWYGNKPSRLIKGIAWPEKKGRPMIVSSNGRPIERSLPLGVIWPGFAINTLFYAAILWMLFTFPFALRHRRRIKRGLCPACAYPVGTSPVCTECGNPVTRRSVEHS